MFSSAIPSPSSPVASSPSLTQSASNSSSSPPQPTTPPRQPKPRYPDLGGVPLHRRGTSQTYERLEDLLREAGYKETRIFTPESDKNGVGGDRDDENDESYQSGGKKQGVGAAVVGFLTGLVTGGGNATVTGARTGACNMGGGVTPELRCQTDDKPDRQQWIPRIQSPSPLANKFSSQVPHRDGSLSAESSEPRTPFMTSSIESLNDDTPKAYRRQNSYPYAYTHPQSRPPSRPTTPSAVSHQYHTPLTGHHHQFLQHHRPSTAQRQLQQQASRSSIKASTNSHNNPSTATTLFDNDNFNRSIPCDQGTGNVNVVHDPRPSRAGNYLRHMVSASALLPLNRPNSTPAHTRAGGVSSRNNESSSDVEGQAKPPLPRNWLDNVARAILFGVASTGSSNISVSPPSDPPSHLYQHQHGARVLRPTRSSLSQTTHSRATKGTGPGGRRSGLSDQTNALLGPPPLAELGLAPPVLSTRLERSRAACSQSVLKAQVVCRSAPGSRASSVVRSAISASGLDDQKFGDGRPSSSRKRHHHHHHNERAGGVKGSNGKDDARHRGRKVDRRNNKKQKRNSLGTKTDAKAREDSKTRVPTLARTHIEGDGWHRVASRNSNQGGTGTASPFLSSASNASSNFSDTDYSSSSCDEDEDEDEGELTLAKMLIPPKRQQSIRSLRKLHSHFTNSKGNIRSPSIISDDSSSIFTTSTTSNTFTTPAISTRRRPSLNTTVSSNSLRLSSSATTLRPSTAYVRVVSGSGPGSRLSGTQEEVLSHQALKYTGPTATSKPHPKSRLSLPQSR